MNETGPLALLHELALSMPTSAHMVNYTVNSRTGELLQRQR